MTRWIESAHWFLHSSARDATAKAGLVLVWEEDEPWEVLIDRQYALALYISRSWWMAIAAFLGVVNILADISKAILRLINILVWLAIKIKVSMMEYFRDSCQTKLTSSYGSTLYETYAIFRLCLTVLCFLCINLSVALDLHNQDPKLTEVPPGLPTNITDLDLRSNEISAIGADNFTGLYSVDYMDLSHNMIAHINGAAFRPCSSLLSLNLGHNKLKIMPATFGPNTPNMINLWISNNPCVIEVTWFSQFCSLQALTMETIGMTDLPNDLFAGLSNLKYLWVANSKAPNLTERTVSLEDLRFRDHIGSIIPDENFMNLKNLTQVIMTGGDFTTSLPRFLGASALEKIRFLFHLETLPDLSHLPELTSLMLSPVKLVCDHRLCWTLFEIFSFSLGSLQYVGCFNPPEFRYRIIYTISKLELRCYDSKRQYTWCSNLFKSCSYMHQTHTYHHSLPLIYQCVQVWLNQNII